MSKTNPQLLIESGGVNNMGASFNSDPYYLGGRNAFALQAATNAGTHVGTLGLEASNDKTTWAPIPLSTGGTTIAVASGSSPDWVHNAEDANFQWVRVAYVRTSGDGQLDAIISEKHQ
jgi:hypothetical protein